MIVDSIGIEFGYELIQVIPYAYYLHTQGLLQKTISAKNTKAFYYFSSNHEEKYTRRIFTHKIEQVFPIKKIFVPDLSPLDQWVCPPYKEYYKNNEFVYDKPLLIISNKYSVEWGRKPINYIDVPALNTIISLLKSKYQIIYFRTEPGLMVEDHQTLLPFADKRFIKQNHPEVLLFEDIYKTTNYNIDIFQLKIFANCDNFISAQGGAGVLSSYFGGKTLIFAREGGEVNTNSINSWWHKFSGAQVIHSKTYSKLIQDTQIFLNS